MKQEGSKLRRPVGARLSAVKPKRLSRAEAVSLFQGSEETLRIELEDKTGN